MVDRVLVTPAAEAMIAQAARAYTDRCCSISPAAAATAARRCATRAASSASARRTCYLGRIAGVPFYIGAAQFEYW